MKQDNAESRPGIGAGSPASRQVSWYETFTFASNIAAQLGLSLDHRVLPLAGTPRWCRMPDDDACKLLSLVLGGVREALANDTHQATLAEASMDVSAAADWARIATKIRLRSHAYIPRKAS